MRFLQCSVQQLQCSFISLLSLVLLFAPATSIAQQDFVGQWYEVSNDWRFSEQPADPVDAPSLTGGHFVFQSVFDVMDADEPIVVDFKNGSSLGYFRHYISDEDGNLIAQAEGGIESKTNNTFFIRHGREFDLPPGRYQLTTELVSPYFIAIPQPYRDSLSHYREAIQWGNVITLVSMGVMLSLAVYYGILACLRRRTTEIMYTFFIIMNMVYNSTALLITPDLFNVHWFYFVGGPILLSNFAYVLFARHLLQIKSTTHPKLNALTRLFLLTLTVLFLIAIFNTNLIIECARFGVWLIMIYGLIAAVARAFEGYKIACFYLVAIVAFFIIGSFAISSEGLDGVYTIYIEHIGLLAVTVEVLLIGLVLAYQFARVYQEKEHNLTLLQQSLQIAHHDALTGLPNRYALDLTLEVLPANGRVTMLDMDNLKLYNDTYGHQKGDEMLKMFASVLSTKLETSAVLHRMGGDEFAITSESNVAAEDVEQSVLDTISYMRKNGFDQADVSFGSANMLEVTDISQLTTLADKRMYKHKRRHKVLT